MKHRSETSSPMGNNCSPETQHASNQGHVTPKQIVQYGAMWSHFKLFQYFIPVLIILAINSD